jgi:hypothetical protein
MTQERARGSVLPVPLLCSSRNAMVREGEREAAEPIDVPTLGLCALTEGHRIWHAQSLGAIL